MTYRRRWLLKWATYGGLAGLATLGSGVRAAARGQEENAPGFLDPWQSRLADLNRRIQQTRQAPLTVKVVNCQGEAIAGQRVKIQHLRHLFNFGATFQGYLYPEVSPGTDSDRRHREAFLQLFNASTVTFYWRSYEPEPKQYQDASLLAIIQWLKSHHFYLRGHPLFWNHNPACLPTWLENRPVSAKELRSHLDRLLTHLSTVIFPHLQEVDVFNELVTWNNHRHPFTDLLKTPERLDLIKFYVSQFKALNPQVKAVINDYVFGPKYFNLLKSLVDHGVPFDGIGQQSHQFWGNWSDRGLTNIIQRLSRLDKPITFTEVTTLAGPIRWELDFNRTYDDWFNTPDQEQRQANYLDFFYRLLYSYPQITGIFLWSFSDRESWLGAPTGILYQDGTPKPAFFKLDHLINHVWRTQGEQVTNERGEVSFLAYEGEYEIQVGTQTVRGIHRANQPLVQILQLTAS